MRFMSKILWGVFYLGCLLNGVGVAGLAAVGDGHLDEIGLLPFVLALAGAVLFGSTLSLVGGGAAWVWFRPSSWVLVSALVLYLLACAAVVSMFLFAVAFSRIA